jgi:hypothetical protein
MKKAFFFLTIIVLVIVNVSVFNPFKISSTNPNSEGLFSLQSASAQDESGQPKAGEKIDKVHVITNYYRCYCQALGYYDRYCKVSVSQYRIDCKGMGNIDCTPYTGPEHEYFNDCKDYQFGCNCMLENTDSN